MRSQIRGVRVAASALGLEVHVLHAGTESELDTAFATLARLRPVALMIAPDIFFGSRLQQLGALTLDHALPAIHQFRAFAAAGGLMSYGTKFTDLYLRSATYVDKILKGAKPADLPVEQPTKFELVINLKTAKTLGLTIPPSVLMRADEVIE